MAARVRKHGKTRERKPSAAPAPERGRGRPKKDELHDPPGTEPQIVTLMVSRRLSERIAEWEDQTGEGKSELIRGAIVEALEASGL